MKNEEKIQRTNKQGFNKKATRNKYLPAPRNCDRILSKEEMIMWTINREKLENRDKRHVYKGLSHFRNLTFYNPNKGKKCIEFNIYANLPGYEKYKRTDVCPKCENKKFEHKECKKTKEYKDYVIRRNTFRYVKQMYILKTRNELSERTLIPSDKITEGLRFGKFELNRRMLQKFSSRELKLDSYYIADIK